MVNQDLLNLFGLPALGLPQLKVYEYYLNLERTATRVKTQFQLFL